MQSLRTFEVVKGVRLSVMQDFATFPSLEACFEKHARLFTEGRAYSGAWTEYLESHNLDRLITQGAVVYATDPDYAKLLRRILSMRDVVECLAASRERSLT